jgi:multisubunit Na+/H+ antiporter MnhB subunit
VVFYFLVVVTATIIALHVASYGYYALKQEKNRRGGLGALLIALLTLATPLLALWVRAK